MLIDPRKAYSYFKNRFLIRKSSQNWYTFDNPFDPEGEGKRKMAVHFDYGHVKCWRTGWKGHIIDFIQQFERVEYWDAKQILEEEETSTINAESWERVQEVGEHREVTLPYGFTGLMTEGAMGQRARNYLEGRGFDLSLLDRAGFGYCNEKHTEDEKNFFGYIIVPFLRKGRLYYFLGRDFIGNFRRYKNPAKGTFGVGKNELVFNEDALEMYKINYVLEGWSDAVTLGKEAVATLGWNLSREQRTKLFTSNADELVWIPDLGTTEQGTTFYQEAVHTAMGFLGHFKVKVVDLSDYADKGKDVNEIGKDNVLYKCKYTEPLTLQAAYEIVMR